MKKFNLIIVALISISLSSCSVKRNITTAKMMDIYGAGVIHRPTIVDLDIKNIKIGGTASSKKRYITINVLKINAVSDALATSNADVLIEPKFEVEIKGNNKKVTVTGYPATYKNFRPITKEDLELVEVGIAQKANEYVSTNQTKRIWRNKKQ